MVQPPYVRRTRRKRCASCSKERAQRRLRSRVITSIGWEQSSGSRPGVRAKEPSPMYDLVVIGSGPAGSSAAITAARSGACVLLLERGRFPRHKVCGEFVSAESLELLSWLLESTGEDLLKRAPRFAQFRLFCDGLILSSELDPAAASISRFDLDAELWNAARNSGVDAREQVSVQAITGNGPFTVSTTADTFESRAVINASGRWSNLTADAQLGVKRRQKWLGVKAHFAEEQPSSTVDLYLFNGGYCGAQNVPLSESGVGNRINVCAMVRADVASSLSEVFTQNPSLRERSRRWRQLTETVTTSPLIFREPRPVNGNILLAGDSAGFVDPFAGDGISLALRSGRLCFEALKPFLANKISLADAARSYRDRYARELLPIFRTASKIR